MRFPVVMLAFLVAVFGLSACQEEVVVKLNPDGSGTVEKTVFYTNEEIRRTVEAQQAQLQSADPKIEPKPLQVEVYNPALLEVDAKAMGKGVKLFSAKQIDNEKGRGFKAVFSFSDINQLRLDRLQDYPPVPEGTFRIYSRTAQPIRFHFVKGQPAALTFTLSRPAPEPPKKKTGAEAENQDKELREVMRGTRDSFYIEPQGKIVETDATFQEGARIIIEDIDLDTLLALPKEKTDGIGELSPATLRGVGLTPGKGMREEWKPEVKVKFQ